MFNPNHLHLLVKGHIKTAVTEPAELNEWFTQLVHKVGMRVIAGPTSVYCNDLGNEGITGTVTLATSHSSIHIWDALEPKMFQFDLYSCKEFSPEDVLSHIDEKFGLISSTWQFIDRNGDDFFVLSSSKQ